MSKQIFLDAPNVGRLEKRYINKAIDVGYVSTAGPFVPEFEEKFSEYLSVKHSVSTQSGTAAIHMALYELGIKRGDEVILPALTFIATVTPISYVGATPVFADVNIKTWNIEPKEIERKITKRTKVILPVHFYGNPCNMDEIKRIADDYGLYIIEDATESLGAKYKKKFTGTFGDLGCFSFNGNKVVTTGGGGMIVGNSARRMRHLKYLANQAQDKVGEYYHSEVGFNYRMTNIEAALGLAQLEKLNEFLERKRTFNAIYREELKNIRNIRFQEGYDGSESSYWMSCIMVTGGAKISVLQEKLRKKGIVTRRVFMPLIELPPYKRYNKYAYPNSYGIYEKGLCLPSSTLNTEEGIYHVCRILKRAIT